MKSCPTCKKLYEDTVKTCTVDGTELVGMEAKDDLIGRILKDSYRIEEAIASGGMGAVYRATQLQLDRNVGVKVILSNLRNKTEIVDRFFREAKLLSQLYHPNVVSIIDFGMTDDGVLFMVMEYLVGKELFQYVPESQGVGLEEIVGVMQQICAGMTAAHHLNLIHRDLKPSNVFIARVTETATVVKVLDFGLVKGLDGQDDGVTMAGEIMGTPGYISPEQIKMASNADARSDVYALGGILYFMMSGHRPYHDLSSYECFEAQLAGPPPDIASQRYREPGIDSLMAVVHKAMSVDPDERYQSSAELYRAIEVTTGTKGRLPDPSSPTRAEPSRAATAEDSWGLKTIVGNPHTQSGRDSSTSKPAKGGTARRFLDILLGMIAGAVLAIVVMVLTRGL